MSAVLHPLTLPLQGVQLIEASAGTGKTWTLAALYLRLVLGHGSTQGLAAGLVPPQILVMTFTEAATAELRGRIRERLAEAAVFFRASAQSGGAELAGDAFLRELRSAYAPDDWAACAQRLDTAAQWMDDAAVFTIHGWSSRMLRQHAFDSASLFQQSRVEDSRALRLQTVQDYWRQCLYGLDAQALASLDGGLATPEALADQLEALWTQAERTPGYTWPEAPAPQQLLQAQMAWNAASSALEAQARSACDAATLALLTRTVEAKALSQYRKAWLQHLERWAQGADPDLTPKERADGLKAVQRFALQALLDKGWEPARQLAFCTRAQEWMDHLQAPPDTAARLLWHAARETDAAYRRAKAQRAQFDFSDLLHKLYDALHLPQSPLAQTIARQYPVALVDEFQDTDPWQYGALERIYGAASLQESALAEGSLARALIMIGDPKQAIYSFRGADLATYLRARSQAQAVHTLEGNFRSTAGLVRAVNHVFASAVQPFGEVPFEPVQARNPEVQPLQVRGRVQPAMTVWHQPFDTPASKERYLPEMAERFASGMVALLQAGAASPGDMAVLVRGGSEARAIRRALQRRGVRSVYLSDRDSVYASPEAADLWRLLRAVANPRDLGLLRACLATRLWGLPLAELQAQLQDESAWDALTERFHRWQAIWQRQGVLPMLHHWLQEEGVAQRLLADGTAAGAQGQRRLTNLLHLGDLLQTASAQLQGEGALVRFLEQQLRHPQASADTAQMRLESDAALVQVITMHKAKGLQYPLVFLPFVSAYREERDKSRDDALRLEEDIRLLYVALTRAERALWLGAGPVYGELSASAPRAKSALSRLLQRQSADDLAERLAAWGACSDIVIEAAPEPSLQVFTGQTQAPAWREALPTTRVLESRWWTASFSALTRDLGQRHSANNPASPASDRDEHIRDALIDNAPRPIDPSDAAMGLPVLQSDYQRFPAGADYGTLLHDLLEWQFARGWPLVQADAASPEGAEWQALLQRKAQRLQLTSPQSGLLDSWLRQVVSTPLAWGAAAGDAPAPGPLRLQDLGPGSAWAEMAFTLPVQRMPVARLDALITAQVHPGQPRQALQAQSLEGMLMGFMDLVFEHEGRYFVLDYKSNRLQDYGTPSLRAAVLAHRYDVQYTLYLLALHRLLRARLPGYDIEHHLGGAVYLFLRGANEPGGGVYRDRPPAALIEALDAAFRSPVDTAPPAALAGGAA